MRKLPIRPTVSEFHRRARFRAHPVQADYDSLDPGTLFIRDPIPTIPTLEDPRVLTRNKEIYWKVDKRHYKRYVHPESAASGETAKKASGLKETIVVLSDGEYAVSYVNAVEVIEVVQETLPDWAIIYLEDAAEGYASDDGFRRLMAFIMTPEQKQWLCDHDLTVNDLSEGQYDGDLTDIVYGFYKTWNEQLGEEFWGG